MGCLCLPLPLGFQFLLAGANKRRHPGAAAESGWRAVRELAAEGAGERLGLQEQGLEGIQML